MIKISKIEEIKNVVINSLSSFAVDNDFENTLIHEIDKDKIMLLHNGEKYLLNIINLRKIDKEQKRLDIMVKSCNELNKLED